MGINISRIPQLLNFRKSPDVYKKELEIINNEIFKMEQNQAALQYQYYLITEFIVSYSRLLYVMVSLIFFFSTLPSTLVEYVLFCGPLLIFYILVSVLKKSLKWYFDNEIKRYNKKLTELQLRKKSILSEVKERVKFKEAKDIIEEYSPSKQCRDFEHMKKEFESVTSKRSSIDNVVKYVLNEEKRNALICKHCKWHNGLALEEEFPFISFRCARCFKMNGPAKSMIPQPTTQ